MGKRKIETVEDARMAIIDLLPPGTSIYLYATWNDTKKPGSWFQGLDLHVRCYPPEWESAEERCTETRAHTPAELVEKVRTEVLPKIHDSTTPKKPPRAIEARPVRRICGPRVPS